MHNPFGSLGLVLFGMALGSVALAQQTPPPASSAAMSTISGQLQTKLGNVATKDPDRAYLGDMAAISRATIALCKLEIKSGRKPAVRAEANDLLTVQQEYDARIQAMDRTFNIDHSP